MYTYFPPLDAATILNANLKNLDPSSPDPQLIQSSRQQLAALSNMKHDNTKRLLDQLEQHLRTFEYPTVALSDESAAPNLKEAYTDALDIADQLVAIASSTKSV